MNSSAPEPARKSDWNVSVDHFNSHYLASAKRREKVQFAESFVWIIDKPSSDVSSTKPLTFESQRLGTLAF